MRIDTTALAAVLVVGLGTGVTAAAAQAPAGTGSQHAARPAAQAVRTGEPIALDGRLDEAAWAAAPPVTELTQLDPVEGAPGTERTDIRFLYDDEALYVGAWLHDTGPITTRLARRDARIPDSDFLVVLLDSYHDHRTAYRFAVNPSGTRRDAVLSGGDDFGDDSWDPIWQVATTVTDSGWVAEIRIPFSQLRFTRAEVQTWGLQIERQISRRQETALFAFTPKLEAGGVARFGHLRGLEGIEPGHRLELLPYVGARAEYRDVPLSPDVDFDNPFRSGSDYFGSAGLDLKYRITSNLTLDATLNPDFGQVEVDPAVINLTAFETRFDEKRPFFVEGAEIFQFGEGGDGPGNDTQLLYSRRIGREPRGDVPDEAVYSDAPGATTILAAAKLTGKTADGWSIGLLDAVTEREHAPYVDEEGVQREAIVEPLANYLVGRLRRDLRAGQTTLGGIVTGVTRDLRDDALAAQLRSAAYAAGADFRHEWADRVWAVTGQLSSSYIRGSEEVITAAQRSSARYFQRPDADYLQVDPAATSLSGYSGRLEVGKQAGAWQGGVSLSATSPAYEINDLGFQTDADRIGLDTRIEYEQTRPGRIFREWNLTTGPDFTWNYGGDLLEGDLGLFGDVEFANYWEGSFRFGYEPATLNDRLTRGGPLTRDPAGIDGSVELESDPRKAYTVRTEAEFSRNRAGAWERTLSLNLDLRPADNWEISVGPEIERSHEVAQYVTTVEDALAQTTYGRRYVFADLDQTTLGIETRLNVTFTPGLSFELFAQPFLSSGDYGALKELRAPRTFDFARYGVDAGTVTPGAPGEHTVDPDGGGPAPAFDVEDRDFNFHSLRGNAVLRWEWRPGSTLFVVWQQSRAAEFEAASGYGPVGDFDLGRDARELFGLRPDNVFLIKVNYWLNP